MTGRPRISGAQRPLSLLSLPGPSYSPSKYSHYLPYPCVPSRSVERRPRTSGARRPLSLLSLPAPRYPPPKYSHHLLHPYIRIRPAAGRPRISGARRRTARCKQDISIDYPLRSGHRYPPPKHFHHLLHPCIHTRSNGG